MLPPSLCFGAMLWRDAMARQGQFMKKVTIIPGCVSCGTCQVVCPEVFEVKNVAHVKTGADLQANAKKIKEAAEMCPVHAIEVEQE